ncbi:uncharacterized protein LOC111711485 isoform X2 [Eurytemora carolleeae]|nr:uncharacterized protein LOC111711485 isoform X2 [Eurytemora carolleeae]|eukprot:XP_023341627.1 uncharacterized protein LOC111711485 isoform X2 [Eurytemora affinis]
MVRQEFCDLHEAFQFFRLKNREIYGDSCPRPSLENIARKWRDKSQRGGLENPDVRENLFSAWMDAWVENSKEEWGDSMSIHRSPRRIDISI